MMHASCHGGVVEVDAASWLGTGNGFGRINWVPDDATLQRTEHAHNAMCKWWCAVVAINGRICRVAVEQMMQRSSGAADAAEQYAAEQRCSDAAMQRREMNQQLLKMMIDAMVKM